MVNSLSNFILITISTIFSFLLVVDVVVGAGLMTIAFPLLPRWLTVSVVIGPICTLFVPYRRKVTITLCVCAIFVPVYGVELYLETVSYLAPRLDAGRRGIDFDLRTKNEVVKDLRERGVDAYPLVPLGSILKSGPDGKFHSKIRVNGIEIFPLAPAVAGKTTVLCNETGKWLTFQADENRFRNPEGIWSQQDIQVAIIGDSFAQGICVEKRYTPASLIGSAVGRTISLGGAAAGPLSQLAVITEYLPKIRPEHVLWFYFEGNDIENLRLESKTSVLRNYLSDGFSQGLLGWKNELNDAMSSAVDTAFKDRSDGMLELRRRVSMISQVLSLRYLQVAFGGGRQISDEELELLSNILAEGKKRAASWGGQVTFIYLPDWTSFYSGISSAVSASQNTSTRLLETVHRVGIPVIDIRRAFSKNAKPQEMFSRPGRHYSIKGYQMLADAVTKEFSASHTLKAKSRVTQEKGLVQ